MTHSLIIKITVSYSPIVNHNKKYDDWAEHTCEQHKSQPEADEKHNLPSSESRITVNKGSAALDFFGSQNPPKSACLAFSDSFLLALGRNKSVFSKKKFLKRQHSRLTKASKKLLIKVMVSFPGRQNLQ